MKKNKTKPLLLALYGMDERTHKTMAMYLKGPYKGKAIIVDEFEAEVDLIDADHIKAKELLEERKQKTPERPIILLSLEKLSIEGTIYVKKPIQTEDLVKALKLAQDQLNLKVNQKTLLEKIMRSQQGLAQNTLLPVGSHLEKAQ